MKLKVYWLDGHEEVFDDVEYYAVLGKPPALCLKVKNAPSKALPYYLIRWYEEFTEALQELDSPAPTCQCGQPMWLIMETDEFRLWACQPTGCTRLKTESKKPGLGPATWYLAEKNESQGEIEHV